MFELLNSLWASVLWAADLILHLDQHLNTWLEVLGPWTYVLIFAIIFLESGVVAFPFLPGDSLLFAMGALAASNPDQLDLGLLSLILAVAGISGGLLNFKVGKSFGARIFSKENSIWFNKKHLLRTQDFYARHGGKTVILARFIPIIRTFAPFVAGLAGMPGSKFALFNLVGGILWALGVTAAGFHFGNFPVIKENFGLVIPMIILISVLPIGWELVSKKFRKAA